MQRPVMRIAYRWSWDADISVFITFWSFFAVTMKVSNESFPMTAFAGCTKACLHEIEIEITTLLGVYHANHACLHDLSHVTVVRWLKCLSNERAFTMIHNWGQMSEPEDRDAVSWWVLNQLLGYLLWQPHSTHWIPNIGILWPIFSTAKTWAPPAPR